jgi:hypothetical protein
LIDEIYGMHDNAPMAMNEGIRIMEGNTFGGFIRLEINVKG